MAIIVGQSDLHTILPEKLRLFFERDRCAYAVIDCNRTHVDPVNWKGMIGLGIL